MTHAINIGLDMGSTAWRAAYLDGDSVKTLPLFANEDHASHLLRCQADRSSALPVRFPSIKMLVAAEDYLPGVHDHTPEDQARAWLEELVRSVEKETGGTPGQLVIAVPALYSTARRTAIRDLALEAGFADVHLLNDSMAAVIGHRRKDEDSALVLVYGMGYSGFEIGVIRKFRGRYRAIAYDGGTSIGGARFDALIMRSCLQLLVTQQHWSPTHTLSADTWLRFRRVVQDIKETLAQQPTASLRLNLTGTDSSPPPLELSQDEFEQGAVLATAPTHDAIQRVLDEANLKLSDINDVLLMGGCIAIGSIEAFLRQRIDRPITILGKGDIAYGAAVYAGQLRLIPTSDTPLVRSIDEQPEEEGASLLPTLKVTMSSLAHDSDDERPLAQFDEFEDRSAPSPGEDAFELQLDVINAPTSQAQPNQGAMSSNSLSLGSKDAISANRTQMFNGLRALAGQNDKAAAKELLLSVIREAQSTLEELDYIPTNTFDVVNNNSGIPPHIQSVLDRAREFLVEQRYQQAVEQSHVAYSMAKKENPDVFEQMIQVHIDAAMAHSSVEGYNKSIEWLNCARGHDPSNSELLELLSGRHFQHAQALVALGKKLEALGALEECLFSNPLHEEAEQLQKSLLAAKSG